MEQLQILLDSFNWVIALSVMVGYAVVDGLYAKYTLEVVALRPFKSATIGAGMHLLLAFGVLNYTENWLYIFPLIIGSWVGTFYLIRFEQKKSLKN